MRKRVSPFKSEKITIGETSRGQIIKLEIQVTKQIEARANSAIKKATSPFKP